MQIERVTTGVLMLLAASTMMLSCGGDDGPTTPPVNKGTPVYVRDIDYAEGRVYDLGSWFEFTEKDTVRTLRVFEQVAALSSAPLSDSALVQRFPLTDSTYTQINVVELSPTDFEKFDGDNRFTHYVIFDSSRTSPLAVYMEIARYDFNFVFLGLDTVGFISDTSIKKLKLIRGLDQDYDSTHSTWDLMWRNVYDIPRGSLASELFLDVRKGAPGTEGTSAALNYQGTLGDIQSQYLAILGLDQFNSRIGKAPDGLLDQVPTVFNSEKGLLIFPARQPFATNATYTDWLGSKTPVLKDQEPSIYALPKQQLPLDSSGYFIEYFVQP